MYISNIELKCKEFWKLGIIKTNANIIGLYIKGVCLLILTKNFIDISIQIKTKIKNWKIYYK